MWFILKGFDYLMSVIKSGCYCVLMPREPLSTRYFELSWHPWQTFTNSKFQIPWTLVFPVPPWNVKRYFSHLVETPTEEVDWTTLKVLKLLSRSEVVWNFKLCWHKRLLIQMSQKLETSSNFIVTSHQCDLNNKTQRPNGFTLL